MLTDAEHAEVLSAEQDQHIHDSCGRCVERNRRLIEAQKRIAELEQRPTHERILKWLAEEHGTAAVPRYRAEFMEPTDG